MASKVSLCNIALSRLGASTITSLTDNTAEAKLCNTYFDDLADEVMIDGSWTSTIRRASLAKTTNTPTFGFTNEFQLPVNPFCLKVLNIDETIPGGLDYRVEDDKLLTDESSVKIRYIARLTDIGDWDPFLKKAFTTRLQAELAYPITGSDRVAESLYQKYIQIRDESIALNGQQGNKDFIISPDLIDVRP